MFTLFKLNLKFTLFIDMHCSLLNIWPTEAVSVIGGSLSHYSTLIRAGHLLLNYSPFHSTPAGL